MNLAQLSRLYELLAESTYRSVDSLFVVAELARERKPKAPLEYGAAFGCSTVMIACALEPGVVLRTVDNFQLYNTVGGLEATLELYGVRDRVHIIKGDTITAGREGGVVKGPIDWLFLDASHREDDQWAEYEALRPHLTADAMILIDDCTCTPRTTARIAVDRAKKLTVFSLHYGLAVIA